MEDVLLKTKLDRLLVILETYNEPQWYSFFKIAQTYLNQGEIVLAKQKIRSAYGGQGSFNDALNFTGAPNEIANEGYILRDELYGLCQ